MSASARASPGPDPGHRTEDGCRASSHAESPRWRPLRGFPTARSPTGSAATSARTWPRLARFEDERPLELVRVAKSESRETTFDHDLHGLAALEPVLERLGAQLCETLQRQEASGRTIGIKVRFSDFSTVTRARSLEAPVNDHRHRAGRGHASC